MPISVTEEQRQAIEALDWLFSESDDDRRTGRSRAIAFSFVRRMLNDYPGTTWFDIWDHASVREMQRYVVQEIQAVASEIGMVVEVSYSSNRCRIRNVPGPTYNVARAHREMGQLIPDLNLPRLPHLDQGGRSTRTGYLTSRPSPVTPAPLTVYDCIIED